eukprot:scaffold853_cov386-Prasinococcus_capsulatus_cf.AAC.13
MVYLSTGYLSNADCITELTAAAYFGTPIVWVKDVTYELPSTLPRMFKDGTILKKEDMKVVEGRTEATATMKNIRKAQHSREIPEKGLNLYAEAKKLLEEGVKNAIIYHEDIQSRTLSCQTHANPYMQSEGRCAARRMPNQTLRSASWSELPAEKVRLVGQSEEVPEQAEGEDEFEGEIEMTDLVYTYLDKLALCKTGRSGEHQALTIGERGHLGSKRGSNV